MSLRLQTLGMRLPIRASGIQPETRDMGRMQFYTHTEKGKGNYFVLVENS
jgi:hypothetical protein